MILMTISIQQKIVANVVLCDWTLKYVDSGEF